jgi:hypothetical protein
MVDLFINLMEAGKDQFHDDSKDMTKKESMASNDRESDLLVSQIDLPCFYAYSLLGVLICSLRDVFVSIELILR